MINPHVYDIKENFTKNDLEKLSDEVLYGDTINEPNIDLGFIYFLRRKKDETEIFNRLDSKFYYIVNPYEHINTDYEDNLTNITKDYLKMKKNEPKILSRAFYKFWEIMFVFDLANQKKLNYAGLAEGPGAFIQAVIHYRKLFHDIKKDRIYGVTIHPEGKNSISMAKQFLGHYNKDNSKLVKIHKTYSRKKILEYNKKNKDSDNFKARDNGDITKVATISNFKKTVSKSDLNLVSGDGGFVWNDENYQEMEAYLLVFGQMVAALKVQEKSGDFVLKIFETFTFVSLKMIYVISHFYKECYIYKPYYSRSSNSEKYIVLKDFIYDRKKDSKFLEDKLKLFESILEKMPNGNFVFDIFPNLNLPKSFVNKFIYLNTKIANDQQIMINKILTYIKSNNYFGEMYHKYKDEQQQSTGKWVENYYPTSKKDYTDKIKELKKELSKKINYNNSEIKLFASRMS